MTSESLQSRPATDVLENAIWESLTGAHAHLAEGEGNVRRYRHEVSPLVGARDLSEAQIWDELAALVGPGVELPLAGVAASPPPDWTVVFSGEGVQMIATDALASTPDSEAVVLGEADAPEMLALVARNKPGPFAAETYRMGTYLGIRREGTLVAMAGERLHPPGWTEISAVCTDSEFRGQGLASRLVLAVAAGIRARGETPFLHASAANVNAIRLYEQLGFELRKRNTFTVVRTPEA